MRAVSYFNFANSVEALKFYQELGAQKIEITYASDEMFSGKDTEIAKQLADRPKFVMNASFELLDQRFYCSDTESGQSVNNQGVNVVFDVNVNNDSEVQAAKDFFEKAQAAGCQIRIPLGPQPWTPLFGMIQDKYGIDWMISGVY